MYVKLSQITPPGINDPMPLQITQTALSQQGFVVHSVLHASNIARLMTQVAKATVSNY